MFGQVMVEWLLSLSWLMIRLVCTLDAVQITQVFTLWQVFEKLCEYGQEVYACFIDLRKTYEYFLWDLLWKGSMDNILLL